ncbi:hypothetical protein HPB47_025288 [Ixodes persulcatus]|uniref:Uncharacterized protein n=1 Tax=Ixodes persulcatus TaxID=34615 RepID=A0AC60Q1X2_IXOPE|nr:hypothetical protein HPB47_025288 [Ixodes persulcatus]
MGGGGYLLLVLNPPWSPDHKEPILQRVAKESEEEKDDEELVREGGTQGSGQSKSNRRPSGTSTIDLRRGSQAPARDSRSRIADHLGRAPSTSVGVPRLREAKHRPKLEDTATTSVGVPRPREIRLRCFQALEAPARTGSTQLRGKQPATTIGTLKSRTQSYSLTTRPPR